MTGPYPFSPDVHVTGATSASSRRRERGTRRQESVSPRGSGRSAGSDGRSKFPFLEVCGARCRLRGADDRGVRRAGPRAEGVGAAVSPENLVGLVLAVLLTGYLVVALLFPEKF